MLFWLIYVKNFNYTWIDIYNKYIRKLSQFINLV
jgi:hypothetical protein